MKHILLDQIKTFNRKNILTPQGFFYNLQLGFWTSTVKGNNVLVKNPNLNSLIRGSKKEDVETGEDLKGK